MYMMLYRCPYTSYILSCASLFAICRACEGHIVYSTGLLWLNNKEDLFEDVSSVFLFGLSECFFLFSCRLPAAWPAKYPMPILSLDDIWWVVFLVLSLTETSPMFLLVLSLTGMSPMKASTSSLKSHQYCCDWSQQWRCFSKTNCTIKLYASPYKYTARVTQQYKDKVRNMIKQNFDSLLEWWDQT